MKIVACLLFVSVLSVAPALAMAQEIAPVTQDVVGTTPSTDNLAAAVVESQDIAPVTQDVVGTSPSTDNLAAAVVESQDIAITAVAVEETPIVEVTTSQAIAAISVAAELTPAVDVAESQDNSGTASAEPAPAVPPTDEVAQLAVGTTDLGVVNDMIAKLHVMSGKEVFDQYGSLLGTIMGVDEEMNLAEVQLTSGGFIALMPETLTDMGFGVIANDVTRSDVVTAANQTDSSPVLAIVQPE